VRFTPSQDALAVIDSYPADARDALLHLRDLIVETAEETDDVDALEEALKFGA
jgi:hypothetical protein